MLHFFSSYTQTSIRVYYFSALKPEDRYVCIEFHSNETFFRSTDGSGSVEGGEEPAAAAAVQWTVLPPGGQRAGPEDGALTGWTAAAAPHTTVPGARPRHQPPAARPQGKRGPGLHRSWDDAARTKHHNPLLPECYRPVPGLLRVAGLGEWWVPVAGVSDGFSFHIKSWVFTVIYIFYNKHYIREIRNAQTTCQSVE